MASLNITAEDYPPGYLEQYQGNPPLVLAITILPLEILFVGLRFYARRVGRVRWGADDTLIIPGAILCVALCACGISNVTQGGAGYHEAYLILTDPDKLVVWAKFLIAVPMIYLAAVLFPKLAILAIYLRIFTDSRYRFACYVIAGVLFANWIGTTIAGFFTCVPFEYL
ncbi:hypothetical protein MMC17_003830 [Xylographa soralifera]|nr:hypothetical protein [Xylographa soralifera]